MVLYSIIFCKSSSFSKVASMPDSLITLSTVAYNALHLLHPVPNTLIFILFILMFVFRRITNYVCKEKSTAVFFLQTH